LTLPILEITKLLARLTVLAPVATEGVDRIRKLVETIRSGDASTTKQIDALKQAVELQSAVNKEVNDQLRVIKSVLENVQRSLKLWAVASVGTGTAAIIVLIFALEK
jgi:predicted PurR-regulated permease PerM